MARWSPRTSVRPCPSWRTKWTTSSRSVSEPKGAPDNCREDYLLLSAALGRQPKAETYLDQLSKTAASIATSAGDSKPTISLVRTQADRIRSMGTAATAGMVMAEAGFPRPVAAPADKVSTDVSTEEMTAIDADWILYGSLGGNETISIGNQAGALWNSLHAVKAGQAKPSTIPSGFKMPGHSPPRQSSVNFKIYCPRDGRKKLPG